MSRENVDNVYYKVVQTTDGPTIAHLRVPKSATVCRPNKRDGQIRSSALEPFYLENNKSEGWGPVDERTVYKVGTIVEVDEINEDPTVVSGAGLHAFDNRKDAKKWMENADI